MRVTTLTLFFRCKGKTFRNGATDRRNSSFPIEPVSIDVLHGGDFMRLINMRENLLCVFCLPPENTNTMEA